jgi:hypothetical protein
MRASGIVGLMEDHFFITAPWPYYNATLVNTFRETMPDQNEHLLVLGNHVGAGRRDVSIFEVVEWLGFDGAVEDLSMWCCLFFGKGVQHHEVVRELREVEGRQRAIKIAHPTQKLQLSVTRGVGWNIVWVVLVLLLGLAA